MATGMITVFGGSGFVGRHLVKRLAQSGMRVRVAVRRPEKALFLRPMGDVGQIELVQANIRDDESVAAAVQGADAVVNLVGLLYESGKQKFAAVHVKGAIRVAQACAEGGVSRLVHVSAIGADPEAMSAYARTKADGEEGVVDAFPAATIVRPGLLFGADDDFFNRFAAIARLTPVIPLLMGSDTRFQPAHVADVAAAIVATLKDPDATAKTFELGGPRVYAFAELMEMLLSAIERRRFLVPLPTDIWKFAAWFLQLMPSPLLTVDQVKQMSADNAVSEGALGFGALAIEPTSAESILPTYLWRFRPAGQFTAPGSRSRGQGQA
jgi:uncharacterized protein YbjT (DUF2867 family)